MYKTYEISAIDVLVDMTTEDQKSETKKLIWKTKVQTYMKRVEGQESNLQSIFVMMWGQYSSTMKSKIESFEEYDKSNED